MSDDAQGEWRADPTGRHESRYFVGDRGTELVRDGDHEAVDAEGERELAGAAAVGWRADPTGWRPDPTGRHESRYFVDDRGTELVRDGERETVDTEGEAQVTASTSSPSQVAGALIGGVGQTDLAATEVEGARRKKRTTRRFVVAAIVLVAVLAIGVGVLLATGQTSGPTTDDTYLASLRRAGQLGQFPSNASAVASGKRVCRDLRQGGPSQGSEVDKIAVRSYCKSFLEGFHVLETITVQGTFTLVDSVGNTLFPSITVIGANCDGSGGYSDIRAGTTVVIKNGAGQRLSQTALEPGTGDSTRCTFPFSFDLKEGEDQYVVSVSHRGEISYTFAQLKTLGVGLTLGS